MNDKKLRKSKNSMLFGVCSGFAEYFEVDCTLVRFATILLTLFSGFGFFVYLTGAIIMPPPEQ